jgi:hypothetical protein
VRAEAALLFDETMGTCDRLTREVAFRRLEGLSWKEIGERYGLSGHAAEARFSKALDRARRKLKMGIPGHAGQKVATLCSRQWEDCPYRKFCAAYGGCHTSKRVEGSNSVRPLLCLVNEIRRCPGAGARLLERKFQSAKERQRLAWWIGGFGLFQAARCS